jgi:hypothetical protein
MRERCGEQAIGERELSTPDLTDMAAEEKKSPEKHDDEDNEVQEAGEESFPASDPPSYSGGAAVPSDEDAPRSPGHLDEEEDA